VFDAEVTTTSDNYLMIATRLTISQRRNCSRPPIKEYSGHVQRSNRCPLWVKSALGLLGKPSWASSNDFEAVSVNPNSDIDAPGASSAIFAMAIVRRPEIAFTLISHAPAQTSARRTLVFARLVLPRSQTGKCSSAESFLIHIHSPYSAQD